MSHISLSNKEKVASMLNYVRTVVSSLTGAISFFSQTLSKGSLADQLA